MYYRLSESTDANVIGPEFPQTEGVYFTTEPENPLFIENYFLKKAPENVLLPKPILPFRSPVTDLISSMARGTAFRLIISDKLKRLLEKVNHQGLHFLKFVLLRGNSELNYWLANPFVTDMEAISYQNSAIEINSYGGTKVEDVFLNNYGEFLQLNNTLKLPLRLSIKNVILSLTATQDLLILNYVSGGIGYYVSEELMNEIKEAGCTGITFEPIRVM
jgi:hypothetical protein